MPTTKGTSWLKNALGNCFALVPMMLPHRVQGSGRVVRDELAARGDFFTRGRGLDLIDAASRVEVPT